MSMKYHWKTTCLTKKDFSYLTRVVCILFFKIFMLVGRIINFLLYKNLFTILQFTKFTILLLSYLLKSVNNYLMSYPHILLIQITPSYEPPGRYFWCVCPAFVWEQSSIPGNRALSSQKWLMPIFPLPLSYKRLLSELIPT